ncbi:CLUMA_CG010316, isoform A [Clunio marinus]|uniref:CLUMA_CG010316, isoform A n=1 Tax=Clunio marinus TaxID=568069 RepID=A0A1J1ID82_9DIPT|nr:CLUMA_CG010316, isoform A [Clunio marinus]
METLVSQLNFSLGCRVCRQLLAKATSVGFDEYIPDLTIKYRDAFKDCTEMEALKNDGLPQRLCSDCAAKLTISFQFRKDAFESAKVLKGYSDAEKSENDIYENMKFEDEEFVVYETIEELDEECSQDDKISQIEEVNIQSGGGGGDDNDAVSFLARILKPKTDSTKLFEVKKISPKKKDESGFDDPNRKHACNVCNKKFQKRSNLIDHLRLHANVKVFSCEYCEKSFVQAGNYKAHLRTHTKEKPYACEYCNKAYSQSSSLKIHIRSHTQEKNYICEVCDKAFTNSSDLGKHKLIHDPVKKFRCDECNRHFTQKIHLRKHLHKHHPAVEFQYDVKDSTTILKLEELDESKVIFEEEFELIDEEEESQSSSK